MSEKQTLQQKARKHFESAYESIAEMIEALDTDDEKKREDAEIRISESTYCAERIQMYKLLLAGGGPEYWLEGELDEYRQPYTVRFYFRNWFTYPERVEMSSSQERTLLEYASRFYFA